MITELARDTPSWGEITRLIDSTPLPSGKSRETVKRSDQAGHAGYGYCASHSRYLWEFRLYLICTPERMTVVWGLANPKIGEREATETMLRHDRHLIRPGQIIVGDKGFAGKHFEAFITGGLEAELIRPDRKDEKPRFGKLGGIRQWVESIFDTMKGQLTLEDHGGRTIPGVSRRVAGRLLALAAGLWHNWLIGAPNKRSLIAYDHEGSLIWAALVRTGAASGRCRVPRRFGQIATSGHPEIPGFSEAVALRVSTPHFGETV